MFGQTDEEIRLDSWDDCTNQTQTESLLDPLGTSPSLLLIQYDISSPFSPILEQTVKDLITRQIIFVSFLLSPGHYITNIGSPLLHVLDYSAIILGYSDKSIPDLSSVVTARLSSIPKGPVALIIDSADTILIDTGSHANTVQTLAKLFGTITQHSSSSRLILPVSSRSPLLPSLVSTAFQVRVPRPQTSPIHTLIHLVLHSPALLSHLVHQYHLALPPVNTVPEPATSRFWSVFTPVAGRNTGEQLVMGVGTQGSAGPSDSHDLLANRDSNSGVVEVRTRSRAGGQKGVRIILRPWRFDHERDRIAWSGWNDIHGLRAYDPRDQLSDAQQQARASVPLPYTNEGKAPTGDSEIIYIPDQADDFDDDDPDDDFHHGPRIVCTCAGESHVAYLSAEDDPMNTGGTQPQFKNQSVMSAPADAGAAVPQAQKGTWTSFVKSLASFTGDLSSLTAPPFILSPVSLTEFPAYWSERPELFSAIADGKTELDRAKAVLKWFISTLKSQYTSRNETMGSEKKPLNPVLGELFYGHWPDKNGRGKQTIVVEQVSHHPPITAYYLANEAKGLALQGHNAQKTTFSSGAIIVRQVGHAVLTLKLPSGSIEKYLITLPKLRIDGIWYGSPYIELTDTSYIASSTGYVSTIKYEGKGYFSGKAHSFKATLAAPDSSTIETYEGQWDSQSHAKSNKNIAFTDVSGPKEEVSVGPLEEMNEWETRKLWKAVAKGIREGDFAAASEDKSRIENEQRQRRKDEAAAGTPWQLKHFVHVENDEDYEKLGKAFNANPPTEDVYVYQHNGPALFYKIPPTKVLNTAAQTYVDNNEPQQIGVPEDWESDTSSRKQDPSSESGNLLPPSKRARKEKYANYVPEEETIRNDYSQRYVDGGEWPQNWVLGAKLEQRFEEYPKQRRLLELKRAAVANAAHSPMHLSSSDLTTLVESQCKFDVILLDPPVSETTDSSKDFTWNDVQAMPIPVLAAEPSFVFMWVGSGAGDGLERGREVLARWGFRRCEDVVWVKTNKSDVRGPGGDAPTTSLLTRTKQHCLMGIKGTVRRSTDSWFVHCNIDTDVIVWDGDPTDPTRKPPEMYSLIENFCLGTRRLEIFGKLTSLRRGWVTVLAANAGTPPKEQEGTDDNNEPAPVQWDKATWETSVHRENGKYIVPNSQATIFRRPVTTPSNAYAKYARKTVAYWISEASLNARSAGWRNGSDGPRTDGDGDAGEHEYEYEHGNGDGNGDGDGRRSGYEHVWRYAEHDGRRPSKRDDSKPRDDGNNMFGMGGGMPVGMPGHGMMFNQNFTPGGFDGGMGGNMPFDQMGGGPGWDGSQRGPFQGGNSDGMMQQQMFMNNMMGNPQLPPRFNGNMGNMGNMNGGF
ncbi:Oxysterol-binding protein [Rhizoctonia solani]|uniref:Oxysterol-binding protein n=1 Tax=Rhizoctonia solani TaxID=456999 RepID=A0A8H7IMY5_9AGAM|nr:Oxysterol-binding protein [Rhizoctonia solani]